MRHDPKVKGNPPPNNRVFLFLFVLLNFKKANILHNYLIYLYSRICILNRYWYIIRTFSILSYTNFDISHSKFCIRQLLSYTNFRWEILIFFVEDNIYIFQEQVYLSYCAAIHLVSLYMYKSYNSFSNADHLPLSYLFVCQVYCAKESERH